ncbi:MAG TPA: agmatine deiminase family protein [Ignavibacteriaceae bacterium]|nr:agmatine deiminase family protein [Ignavibacteriaceae bacterium]
MKSEKLNLLHKHICSIVAFILYTNDFNRITLGILSELITERPVIGIHSVDLVWGLGTLHCLTHEQPV